MNRVDAAVIRDLRRGIAAIQQHTLQTMFTALPQALGAAKPQKESNLGVSKLETDCAKDPLHGTN